MIPKFIHPFARKKILLKRIEEQSEYFFERLDLVEDNFLRNFYSQVICCTIGDIYDFFWVARGKRNVFSKNLRSLDKKAQRSLYKLTAMYHTLHYLAGGAFKCGDPADMLEGFREIFDLNDDEKTRFSLFAEIYCQSETMFEVEFTRYAIKCIFVDATVNPFTLAYVGFYFMHSYSQFISTNQHLVA